MRSNAQRHSLLSPIQTGDDVTIVRDHKGYVGCHWYVLYTTRKRCVLYPMKFNYFTHYSEVEYIVKHKSMLKKIRRSTDWRLGELPLLLFMFQR